MTSEETQTVPTQAAGTRLDQFLVAQLPDISRARVQELIAQDKILVDGKPAKPSLRLRGGESISCSAPAPRPPLRATAEEIPLDIVYEDDDLAVVNKPAGMMVHAGAGSTETRAIAARWSTRCCTASAPCRESAANCVPESCIASTATPAG